MSALSSLPLHRKQIIYWWPAVAVGVTAWLVFSGLGSTPPIRAAGLATAAAGVAMCVRWMGAPMSLFAGIALAFSPVFWSQTGGVESLSLLPVTLALAVAAGGGLLLYRISHRFFWGVAIGAVIFAVLFWSQIAGQGSLRVTTSLMAWLLFLLIDAVLVSNPRVDGPERQALGLRHTAGIPLLLILGVVNDPLFVLALPAVILGLVLTGTRLPLWYWLIAVGIAVLGAYGVAVKYMDSGWWFYSSAQAEMLNVRVPYMMADGWREPSRWLVLFTLVISQFSLLGVVLGVLGLARMARWYPPLGVVSMVLYAAYALFGLLYFGKDAAVLLLPLLMIQVMWMAYAVYAAVHWLQRTIRPVQAAVVLILQVLSAGR